jgi:tetratricopeptide (TPR) repeat protein
MGMTETKTKIIEPPEVKLLRKGRYDEAAKAILDSIKDEKKDSWKYQSVAAVYYARAQSEPTSREKWLAEANRYVEKSIDLSPDDFVNLMSGAFGIERIADSSSQPCPYYAKATEYARDALAQLKGDSISVGNEKMPTEPIRADIEKHLSGLNDKVKTKCPDKP